MINWKANEREWENFQRIWTKLRHHRHGGTSASTTQLWHLPGPITAEKKAESSQDRVLADTSPSLQNPGTLFLQLSLVPLKMVARKFPWRTITLGFLHFLEIWFGKGKGFWAGFSSIGMVLCGWGKLYLEGFQFHRSSFQFLTVLHCFSSLFCVSFYANWYRTVDISML